MSWSAFDQTVDVLRGTDSDILCDRCAGPALVLADTPAGPFSLCGAHFSQHALALVERGWLLTLVIGLH